MADSWSDRFVSSECVASRHSDCWHVHGGSYSHRPAAHHLCRCACHQDCNLVRNPLLTITREACTCPGMVTLRDSSERRRDRPEARSEPPAAVVLDVARHALAERRARREIDRTLRRRAPGRSREEVTALIIDEYERHGLRVPAQPLLDYKADLYRIRESGERERIRSEMESVMKDRISEITEKVRSLFRPSRES